MTPTADPDRVPEALAERAVRRVVDGLTPEAAARELGLDAALVRALLARHGVTEPPPRSRREPPPELPPRGRHQRQARHRL